MSKKAKNLGGKYNFRNERGADEKKIKKCEDG